MNDDAELSRAYPGGNEAAFAELVERDYLFGYSTAFTATSLSLNLDLPIIQDYGLILPLRLDSELHVDCSFRESDGFCKADIVLIIVPASFHRRPRL